MISSVNGSILLKYVIMTLRDGNIFDNKIHLFKSFSVVFLYKIRFLGINSGGRYLLKRKNSINQKHLNFQEVFGYPGNDFKA